MVANLPARVCLAAGFLAATIAYGAWTASRTALDPDATGDVAEALLESPVIRDNLAEDLRSQVAQATASDTLDPDTAAAIDGVLSDPRMVDAFGAAIASMQSALLDGRKGEVTLDVTEVTASVRDALATVDPALAARVGEAQPIELDLGDNSLPAISRADDRARQILVVSTVLALALIAIGVAIHPSQRDALARTGRRVALLAVGPVVAFVVLPWLLGLSANDGAEIASSVLDVYAGRVLPSAAVLAIAGVALWIGARTWPRARREAAPVAGTRPGPPNPYATTSERPAQRKMYL